MIILSKDEVFALYYDGDLLDKYYSDVTVLINSANAKLVEDAKILANKILALKKELSNVYIQADRNKKDICNKYNIEDEYDDLFENEIKCWEVARDVDADLCWVD